MRIHLRVAARALPVIAAAALACAACQSDTPTDQASADASSEASTPEPDASTDASTDPTTDNAAAPDAADSDSSAAAAPTTKAATPAATGTKCTTASLKAAKGRVTGDASQKHITIVWTNTSSHPCTMTGFGVVKLEGPSDPMGSTFELRRTSKTPAAVKLAPGGTAHTVITWAPPSTGSHWVPTKVLLSPPDDTKSAELPWSGGPVLRQDGATHPGTYFDPVQAGSG